MSHRSEKLGKIAGHLGNLVLRKKHTTSFPKNSLLYLPQVEARLDTKIGRSLGIKQENPFLSNTILSGFLSHQDKMYLAFLAEELPAIGVKLFPFLVNAFLL